MQILRLRIGFQADHSSSSYLFYAVDRPVSPKGQQLAHRYSSRAEVDARTARYLKWGDSEIPYDAYKMLLGSHYDVMASESYDWWTLMIAVPKNAEMKALLAPFHDARGYEDLGVEMQDCGRRLVIIVYCMFNYEGPVFEYEEDTLETLVEILTAIRAEILGGDVSFLRTVALFYDVDIDKMNEAGGDELATNAPSLDQPSKPRTKAQLQQECSSRGIGFLKSWNKEHLRAALAAAQASGVSATPPARERSRTKSPRLSRTAQRIIASLDRP
jgi:hypothetical protein